MKFVGGPRDGQDIEPEHLGADEIQVVSTEMSEDHQPLSTTRGTYLPDSFGRMTWQNPESVQ